MSQYLQKHLSEVDFDHLISVMQFDIIMGSRGKYFYQALKQAEIPHDRLKDLLKQYQAIMNKQIKNKRF